MLYKTQNKTLKRIRLLPKTPLTVTLISIEYISFHGLFGVKYCEPVSIRQKNLPIHVHIPAEPTHKPLEERMSWMQVKDKNSLLNKNIVTNPINSSFLISDREELQRLQKIFPTLMTHDEREENLIEQRKLIILDNL